MDPVQKYTGLATIPVSQTEWTTLIKSQSRNDREWDMSLTVSVLQRGMSSKTVLSLEPLQDQCQAPKCLPWADCEGCLDTSYTKLLSASSHYSTLKPSLSVWGLYRTFHPKLLFPSKAEKFSAFKTFNVTITKTCPHGFGRAVWQGSGILSQVR